MNIYVFVLVIVGCVYHTVGETHVPVSFVTKQNIAGQLTHVNYFHVGLCGGLLYDNDIALVHINLPNRGWNELQGDFVRCDVLVSDLSKIIGGNHEIDGHVQTFSFFYRKEYGDLWLKCTTPNTPGTVTYTLALRFPDSLKTGSYVSKETRYVSTEAEMSARNDVETKLIGQSVFVDDLVSVFLTDKERKVKTQDNEQLVLHYCFSPNEPGYIGVAITAVDQKSGFATYVCPGETGSCAASTPYADSSGASVNFVRAIIKDGNTIGPVKVMVRGDGRFGQNNSYLLTASKFISTYDECK